MRWLILFVLFVTPAVAQEYDFKMNTDELNTVSDGLQTQPFGKVNPLINKLRSQFLAQQPKPEVKQEVPKQEPPKQEASPQEEKKDGSSPDKDVP